MRKSRVTVRFPNRVLLSIQEFVEDGPFYSQSQAIEKAIRDKFGPSKRIQPKRFEEHAGVSNLADPDDLSANSRLTIRLPDDVLDRVESASNAGFYMDRSEAIRDACREAYLEELPVRVRSNKAVEELFGRPVATEVDSR